MPSDREIRVKEIQDQLAALVQKELLEVSELQSMEDRLKVIAEKSSKAAPPEEEETT